LLSIKRGMQTIGYGWRAFVPRALPSGLTMHDWLRGPLPAVDEIVHRSDLACIGRFRCDRDDPLFEDSGPIRNHVFVFPRASVVIEHESRRPFVAGPNVVTLYNAGQPYRRRSIAGAGDDCDWFAVAPDILARAAERHGLADPSAPFASAWVSSPPELYRRQRALVDAIGNGQADPLLIDALVLELLDLVLGLTATRPQSRDGRCRSLEEVKSFLATTLDEPLTLRELAERAGVSVFHLCRTFRRETGFTVSAYRQQLRLRRALDSVLASRDLLTTALQLGFDSHSHFTYAFRRAFGVTPSELRKRGGLPVSSCRS
jgi:AraC family transcriptional regulator